MPPLRRLDVVLDSVKRLQRIGATANLLNLLQKQHPADLAEVLTALSDANRSDAFNTLVEHNPRLAMEALSEVEVEVSATLLVGRTPTELVSLFEELPSDDAAALINQLPEPVSSEVIELMRRADAGEAPDLLAYQDQTAGRIMNPEVFALTEDLTAGEAIEALQQSREVEMVFYLYVVDERRHLVGVVSLRRLLLVAPETPLKRIMTSELVSARVDTDQEEVALEVANYNLLAIPVVDDENKLVGIITVDDVIDVIKDEATEDILRLAGVSADEHIATSPWEAWRKRLPWLGVNLVAATLGALVIRQFQATIEQVVALAALMTVVASVSGNAATQTLTVIVRGLAIGELAWSNARRVLGKEVVVGLANGLLLGLAGSVIAWLVFGNPYVGAILAGAMVINLLIAAIAATLIPLSLRALKFDPALASAVFITTMTDMFGFFAFLGLATAFLPYLQRGL
ncbi:MAG: magnesium transporter [Acidobacteria bacterium]|nr:magnesium transporter [Acidobacteriota bacterium]MYD70694.1 magnesium transporter [Acidobacteriota bacterium]MYJ03312.1 magnesium transporter [Acidobacteriota bacterium]